jgi:hypothetical protein
MTGLLVSVRSAVEAEAALAGGADLIDVKEPLRGSLGAAEPAVWRDVLSVVAWRVPVSAALGELARDFRPAPLEHLRGFRFAKVGLAGCATMIDWPARWLGAMQLLPAGTRPVAVAYADWRSSDSPPAAEMLPIAAYAGAAYLLIDTFDKSAGRLLDYVAIDELAALSELARQHGIRLVLAGSLDEAAIVRLAPLAPAYFAVRGAACDADRTQAIALPRVKRLAEVVRTSVAAGECVVA